MDAVRRLEAFLAFKGWSTADFARASGLAHSTISKIRHGQRSAGLLVALRVQEATRSWPDGPIKIEEWGASLTSTAADHASEERKPRRAAGAAERGETVRSS